MDVLLVTLQKISDFVFRWPLTAMKGPLGPSSKILVLGLSYVGKSTFLYKLKDKAGDSNRIDVVSPSSGSNFAEM